MVRKLRSIKHSSGLGFPPIRRELGTNESRPGRVICWKRGRSGGCGLISPTWVDHPRRTRPGSPHGFRENSRNGSEGPEVGQKRENTGPEERVSTDGDRSIHLSTPDRDHDPQRPIYWNALSGPAMQRAITSRTIRADDRREGGEKPPRTRRRDRRGSITDPRGGPNMPLIPRSPSRDQPWEVGKAGPQHLESEDLPGHHCGPLRRAET